MLVTFSCEVYSNVTLFGPIGQRLLKIMGCQDTPSGLISATEVHRALEKLRTALETEKESSLDTSLNNQDADFGDENVSLAHRALPLMELLKAAEQEKCNVWWEAK